MRCKNPRLNNNTRAVLALGIAAPVLAISLAACGGGQENSASSVRTGGRTTYATPPSQTSSPVTSGHKGGYETPPPEHHATTSHGAARTTTASAEEIVDSYFDAINASEYRKAWELGGRNLDSSYSHFKAGFSGTKHDTWTTEHVHGDIVTGTLAAKQDDGTTQFFAGHYTARDGSITSAHLVERGGRTAPKTGHESREGKVVFKVTGSGKPGITYGTASDHHSGNDHHSKYGLAYASLPFESSMTYNDKAVYYSISAQLTGSTGDITCEIEQNGKVVAKGHASGDYNICMAEARPKLLGNGLKAISGG
jgi:hypothetical protein